MMEKKATVGYTKINEQSNPDIDSKFQPTLDQEKTLKAAKLIMSLVQQKLFKWFPMWRSFYTKMPPIASFGAGSVGPDGVGTMCTTGTAIFYDPAFVVKMYNQAKEDFADQFTDESGASRIPNAGLAIRTGQRHPMDYCLFVIIHEILHCSLSHHIRMPRYESKYIDKAKLAYYWNIAADYEINHTLMGDVKSDLYEMVPGGVRADMGGFEVPDADKEFFMTSSAEKIFWRIVLNIEERMEERGDEPLPEEPESGEGDEGDGEPGEEGEGDGSDGDGEGDGSDGDGEGDGSDGDGEGDGSSGSGGSGSGEGDNNDGPLKRGSIIFDREAGTYGKVTSVQGDSVEYDPMSEADARAAMKK